MSKSPTLKALLKTATLPERAVSVVMDRSLVAEFQHAEDRLQDAQQRRASDSRMASDVTSAANDVEALRTKMKDSTAVFTLRGFRRDEWRAMKAAHPIGDKPSDTDRLLGADTNALFNEAVRKSIVSPDIDDEDWAALLEVLTDGEWQRFTNAVYALNEEGTDIPFSRSASAALRRNAGA